MISKLSEDVARVFRAVVPDPFVLAVLLTFGAAVLALVFGDFAPESTTGKAIALLDAWRVDKGVWAFLAFSMQMCLVLVTGQALAESAPIRTVLRRMARVPRSAGGAAALVAFVAAVAGMINWGLGLIAGAVLAREVGRAFANSGRPLHYPLIAAAGYTGMMVWHGGLSGSAPLAMTTREGASKVLPEAVMSQVGSGIGLDQTIFSPLNLAVSAGLLVIAPVAFRLMTPPDSARYVAMPPEPQRVEPPATPAQSPTFADRLDSSGAIAVGLGALFLAAAIRFAWVQPLTTIGINEINLTMFGLGLMLHRSLRTYGAAAEEGAKGCAGIIVQFPLYAGVMTIMVASGLVQRIAGAIASVGDGSLAPLFTFLAACIVNMFVPSGGGQWGVQGPIAIESGVAAGVPLGKMVLSVAYGDQITNMLQPFWALPLLSITGVRARDIIGYNAVAMMFGGVWVAGLLVLM